MIEKVKCRHCGYRWYARVAEPKKCPKVECQKPWPTRKKEK